jgi:hypothetical protein
MSGCPATVQPAEASPATPARPRRGLLPARIRAPRRPRWWQELMFIGACYWLYSLVRNAVPEHERQALARAGDVLRLETRLHLAVEHSVNAFVASRDALAYLCDYYYATLHFLVTIGVMVWLYRQHPLRYRPLRSALMATTLAALAGFWLYALAPPRMLAGRGFTDTIVAFHTWGSWGSSSVDSASNQFAAMPSLHIGWALWCALVVVRLTDRRWIQATAALYPVATLFVILGTANHFLLDAFGGVAVVVIGFGVQHALAGESPFTPPPVPLPRQSREMATLELQAKNTRS